MQIKRYWFFFVLAAVCSGAFPPVAVGADSGAQAKTGRDVWGNPEGMDVQGNPNDKNAEGARPKDDEGNAPKDMYGNKTGTDKK